MSDESRLKAYQALVETRLGEILPPANQEPSVLHEAMRYSALAPGKRLRPALAMAAAEAVGGDPRAALDVGCALELVHCFSLIHDDLPCIDNDDLRRGRPTCHKVYGEAMALLAGDALFALAFDVASESVQDDAKARAIVVTLAKATGSMGLVGGEVMDILAEGRGVSLQEIREVHRRKTGALIAASCVTGGIAVGATPEDLLTLKEFGDKVGLAFQVVDDILNETGDAAEIGKSVGSDRERGKATYPAAVGLAVAQQEADTAVSTAVGQLERLPGDVSGLRSLAELCRERYH